MWETRAPMPVFRQELATGALNGKLYVLGGYDQDRNNYCHSPRSTTRLQTRGLSRMRFPTPLITTPPLWQEKNSTVSVPELGRRLFTIRTAMPGLRELPVIMCTAGYGSGRSDQ